MSSKHDEEILLISQVSNDSIHRMPLTFIIQQNIFVFTIAYILHIQYMVTTTIYQKQIHLWL